MRGVITAPTTVITGAFNVRFSFPQNVDFTADNFHVETLSGDALGDVRDHLKGNGNHYMLMCYIPTEKYGRSRVSLDLEVDGAPVDAKPVEIEYDTVRSIVPVWGTPIERGNKVEIPLTLPAPVVNLDKGNFQVSVPARCHLYGSGREYQFVVSATKDFDVMLLGRVRKENGLEAVIEATVIEVNNRI